MSENSDIKHYFVESILILVFCCTPMGIVSLVYGAQAQAALAEGKIEDARAASAKAKIWVKWGFILGIIAQLLSVILLVCFVVVNANNAQLSQNAKNVKVVIDG